MSDPELDPWSPDEAAEHIADRFALELSVCRELLAESRARMDRSLASETFMRASTFERHLTADLVGRLAWEAEVEPQVLEEAKLKTDELPPLEREFGKWGSRLWTGHNLHDLVAKIEDQWTEGDSRTQVWQYLRVVHRDNNQILHSSISALVGTVTQVEADGRRLRIGPSEDHIEQALWAAHWCYSNMFTLVSDRFGLRALTSCWRC